MKNLSVIILSLLIFGCREIKNGIFIKNNEISIVDKRIVFNKVTLLINQSRLKQTGSDMEGEAKIVHYNEEGNRKIDLVFKTISLDTLIQYQIFARLIDKKSWLPTDTLKLFFNTPDSISEGIYSILYGSVYCWTKPVKFTRLGEIKAKGGIQFAYWKNQPKSYVFVMPLGGKGFAFDLTGEDKGFGAAGVTEFNIETEGDIPVLSLSVGTDFYDLISRSFQYSFEAIGIPDNLRVRKIKPTMYNFLGWASWNAFKHDLSEKKILEAAKSLKSEHIPVKWFLIDDGWLDITDNKLNSYQPDRTKFPLGFSNLTSILQRDFGICNVGVWHTLNGYWEGINKSGQLPALFKDMITYSDRIVWLRRTTMPFCFVNPFSTDGYRFYDKWYDYLSSQGITFVKVDNQLVIKKLADGNSSIWSTGEKNFENLHTAAKKYFIGNVINCMNMTNNDYYHYSNTTIARTVEDYNPDNKPDLYSCEFSGNAAAHIIASVHNSVWLSNIVWPDYDMFESGSKDAWYYALAKIMSNGPVYITDKPGKHDAPLLKSITFSDGELINADRPALPTEDCLFQLFDSEKPFKIFSTYRDNGLIAAWNVSDRDTVSGSFSPSEIRTIKGNKFVVFNFFGKLLSEVSFSDKIPVNLKRMGCNIYTVIPLENEKAVIGDINKIIPVAAISDIKRSENSMQFHVKEKCTVWIYSKTRPMQLRVKSVAIQDIQYDQNIISVKVEMDDSKVEILF